MPEEREHLQESHDTGAPLDVANDLTADKADPHVARHLRDEGQMSLSAAACLGDEPDQASAHHWWSSSHRRFRPSSCESPRHARAAATCTLTAPQPEPYAVHVPLCCSDIRIQLIAIRIQLIVIRMSEQQRGGQCKGASEQF